MEKGGNLEEREGETIKGEEEGQGERDTRTKRERIREGGERK